MAKNTLQEDAGTAGIMPPIPYTELKNFISEQVRTVNESYLQIHKNYSLDTSDRALELKRDDEERRTNIKTPMTLMFVDKVINVIKKIGGRFTITDLFSDTRGEDSEQIIEEMLELVDRVLKEEKVKNTLNDVMTDAALLGPGILKVSYEKEEKVAEYLDFDGKKAKATKHIDGVTLDYTSPYNFFPYYHTNDLDEAAFIAERMLMTKEQADRLAKKYGKVIDWKKVIDKYDYIDDRDYNALKNSIPFYAYKKGKTEDSDTRVDDSYKISEDKKLYEIIELHTQTHTWFYVNGVEYGPIESREQKVLFGYRYRMIGFRKLSGSIRRMGIGHYLMPLQHEFDVITNSRIDNVLMAVNKMVIVTNDVALGRNSKRVKVGPGKTFRVSDPKSMQFVDMGEIPGSSYRETENLFGLAQAVSGVTGMALGLQNKVERVAGSSEMLKNAIDDQLIEIVDSIARLRSRLMKDILVLTLAYMSREQLAKFLGKNNKLQTLSIDSIINDYEFSYEPDTESTKMNAVSLQLLINYLNTVVGLADAQGRPVTDVKGVAEKIREYLGLPDSFELSEQDLIQRIGGQTGPDAGGDAITALQQAGAGDMQGFATNQEGVNADTGTMPG